MPGLATPFKQAWFKLPEAAAGAGPATGSGLLLEDGISFLLLESGTTDFLLLEE